MNLTDLIKKPDGELFFSRGARKDPRLGETVKTWRNTKELSSLLSSKLMDAAIIGIPDDTGIIKNKGRPGARKGPEMVRKKFYALTPGCESEIDKLGIVDIGDIGIEKHIEKTHQNVEKVIIEIAKRGIIPIVIGGGHDFAHPDMVGFIKSFVIRKNGDAKTTSRKKPFKFGRINIDSHFDVRDLSFGITSGTAFYQTLELADNPVLGKNFVEFGIQEQRNSKAHYEYLQKKKATIIYLSEIQKKGVKTCWNKAVTVAEKNTIAVALSIDIDVVRTSDAPGASAPSPNGLAATEVEQIAYLAGRHKNIQMLDIFEISPPFDVDERTSALGASIIFHFLKGLKEKKIKPKSK